jgi:hypothetical protein
MAARGGEARLCADRICERPQSGTEVCEEVSAAPAAFPCAPCRRMAGPLRRPHQQRPGKGERVGRQGANLQWKRCVLFTLTTYYIIITTCSGRASRGPRSGRGAGPTDRRKLKPRPLPGSCTQPHRSRRHLAARSRAGETSSAQRTRPRTHRLRAARRQQHPAARQQHVVRHGAGGGGCGGCGIGRRGAGRQAGHLEDGGRSYNNNRLSQSFLGKGLRAGNTRCWRRGHLGSPKVEP